SGSDHAGLCAFPPCDGGGAEARLASSRLGAVGAAPRQLDGQPIESEPALRALALGGGDDFAAVDLRHLAAIGADQELADMSRFRLRASDIGIERFQPMDESLGDQ